MRRSRSSRATELFAVGVDTGGINYLSTKYQVYVLPIGSTPPVLTGSTSLPTELATNAVASMFVSAGTSETPDTVCP